MLIYILILLLFIILMIRFDVNHNMKGKRAAFIFEAIILILLFGLRYRVGGDSLMYEDEWDILPSLDELRRMDLFSQKAQPLFYLLVALLKEVGGNFVLFQIVHAIIVNTVFFSVINRYGDKKFTAVILYYLFMSLNSNTEILREALAVAVFLLSLKSFVSRKWVSYYLYCVVAIGFHISALMCLLLPLVYSISIKPWKIKKLLLISLAFVVLSVVYVNYLPSLASLSLFSFLSMSNMYKLEVYSALLGTSNINGYIIRFLGIGIILFFAYVMRKNGLSKPIYNFAINMTLVFQLVDLLIPIMGTRWGGYFSILYYMIIADVFYSFHHRRGVLKLITVFCFAFMLFSKYFTQIAPDPWAPGNIPTYVRYIPYKSVFDKERVPDREASNRESYDI